MQFMMRFSLARGVVALRHRRKPSPLFGNNEDAASRALPEVGDDR